MVLETRWQAGVVTHLLGYSPAESAAVLTPLKGFNNLSILKPLADRAVVQWLDGSVQPPDTGHSA